MKANSIDVAVIACTFDHVTVVGALLAKAS